MKRYQRCVAVLLALLMTAAGCALAVAEENSLTGIVVDASMNALTVETRLGRRVSLSAPQGEVDVSGLADGLTLGSVVELRFAGAVDPEAEDLSGATLSSIVDGDIAKLHSELEISLEGTTETWTGAPYVGDGALIWYDAEHLEVEESGEEGICFIPVDEGISEIVGLQISRLDAEDADVESAIGDLERQLCDAGYVLERADDSALPEGLNGGGWVCCKDGEEMLACVLSADGGAPLYYVTAFYPEEAAEGWGARMRAMISSFELL